MGGTPPRPKDSPTGPAPSGKWDGRDRRRGAPWCGLHHGRRSRGSVNRRGNGREELRHGERTVPQVPLRQVSGMGGTGEEVRRGVVCTTAGGAEVVYIEE